jgi:hypothetical protein
MAPECEEGIRSPRPPFDSNMPAGGELFPENLGSPDKQTTPADEEDCADSYQHTEDEQIAKMLCSLQSIPRHSFVGPGSNANSNYGIEPPGQKPPRRKIARKKKRKQVERELFVKKDQGRKP